jgi:hypothetical protein
LGFQTILDSVKGVLIAAGLEDARKVVLLDGSDLLDSTTMRFIRSILHEGETPEWFWTDPQILGRVGRELEPSLEGSLGGRWCVEKRIRDNIHFIACADSPTFSDTL